MTRFFAGRPMRAALFALPVLLLVACQMIAGIEDDDYGTTPPPSAQCVKYCDSVKTACTGNNKVYATPETCLGVCRQLPSGDTAEPDQGNTVACRANQASLAVETGAPNDHCPAAGPGGAGLCGTNCASYCMMLKSLCPETYKELDRCESQCNALPDTGAFDVSGNYNGDTIQCRLVHLSAATGDPGLHCSHAQLKPTEIHCFPSATAPRDCKADCKIINTACTGDFAVYESNEQCEKVCAVLPPGVPSDKTQNTSACRRYHAYNALISPSVHCTHASLLGDGHCGGETPNVDKTGNCESYCMLAKEGCPTLFGTKYESDAACQKECSNQPLEFGAKLDGQMAFRVKPVEGTSTLQCRALYVARAITQRAADPTVDAPACANVFGGPACP